MGFIDQSFRDLEQTAQNFTVEVLASVLKQEWVEQAAAQGTQPTQRNRKLPGPFVVWLVICLGVYRSLSINNVVRRIGRVFGMPSRWKRGESPTSRASVAARSRLGFRAMRWLLAQFQAWLLENYREAMSWRNLLVVALDGTTFKTPDSPANRRYFGCPGSSRGGRAAFPQLRVLALVSAKLRLCLGAWFAPYRRHEVALAMRILDEIPRGTLVIMDRAYLAWWFLWRLTQRGDHFVVRVKRGIRRQHLYRLGPCDWLVRITLPGALRRRHPDMPRSIELREVAARIRGRWYHYFTSLTDARVYPAGELIHHYASRWEIETSFDELKTHQGNLSTVNHPVLMRSENPRRVLQEAYGLIIAYNVIRTLLLQAGLRHGVDPLRLSFVDTLDRIREAAPVMAAARTEVLPRLFAELLSSIAQCRLPRRNRRNPRHVCVKVSGYLKKHKPYEKRRRA